MQPGCFDYLDAECRLHCACTLPSNRLQPCVTLAHQDTILWQSVTMPLLIMCSTGMRAARRKAIECARHAHRWGVVLGTLGRQGNPHIVNLLQQKLQQKGLHFTTILLSEVSPVKLALIGHIDAWVQVACPRLSIDWGEGFTKPTLTPYEALIALGEVSGWWETSGEHPSDQQPGTSTLGATDSNGEAVTAGGWNNQQTASRSDSLEGYGAYPMDYYAKDGGIWNSSYHKKPGLAEAQAP